jgi:hypothetical protein
VFAFGELPHFDRADIYSGLMIPVALLEQLRRFCLLMYESKLISLSSLRLFHLN